MLQGYLSTAWVQAMEDYGEKHPNCRMTAILRGLRDEFFEPIWVTRNHILHHLPNRYNDATEKSNEDKLQWYYTTIDLRYYHSTTGSSPSTPKNKFKPCDLKQNDNGCGNLTTCARYTRQSYNRSRLANKCCPNTLNVPVQSNHQNKSRNITSPRSQTSLFNRVKIRGQNTIARNKHCTRDAGSAH
jgi:hypothetical protein